MPHPFAPIAAELKTLQHKLYSCTYEAVFGRTIEVRQRATTDAVALADNIEKVFMRAAETASQVATFMRVNGGLMQSVTGFISLVEQESQPALASAVGPMGSCSNTPVH
jgi:hypothetical protein